MHEISDSVVGLSLFLFGAELHSSSKQIARVKNNDRSISDFLSKQQLLSPFKVFSNSLVPYRNGLPDSVVTPKNRCGVCVVRIMLPNLNMVGTLQATSKSRNSVKSVVLSRYL